MRWIIAVQWSTATGPKTWTLTSGADNRLTAAREALEAFRRVEPARPVRSVRVWPAPPSLRPH